MSLGVNNTGRGAGLALRVTINALVTTAGGLALRVTINALVTTAGGLALLGFAAPDLAGAQTQPQFERKYVGTWCRVSSDPEGATLRREPRGKICSPERRVVITATEVHGMFAPFEYDVRPAPTSQGLEPGETIKVVGKFEMMHCKVKLAEVNMNGWAWMWFACSNGEHLRGVFLIDGRELATSREMLREEYSAPAAAPKVDDACLREMREIGITRAQAKRICDPKNQVKPDEFGWVCEGSTLSRVKGEGSRLKRDALCE
jgi:hypothetical protein